MARTATNKNTGSTNKDVENVQETIKETTPTETKETVVKENKPQPVRRLDRHDYVEVYNNTTGKFVYVSRVTGVPYFWEEYGDVVPLEFHELQYMASGTKFFKNGWLFIKDEDAIRQLNIGKYMEDTISPEEVDHFFELSIKNMEAVLEKATKGTKQNIAGRAIQLYQSGELDSAKKIKFLENKLNIEIATDEDDE